jgi:sugar phosphate isomerase/epimerase
MILGISSYTFGWSIGVPGFPGQTTFDERDLLSKVLDYDLRCLQIGDNLPVHTFTELRKESLKLNLQRYDVRLELGAAGLTDEHLRLYIELASYFNSPLLRFVIDRDEYKPSGENVISILRNALPVLKNADVTLGIENHDRFRVKELATIMDAVGSSSVGICLDCANSLGAGEGIEWVVQVLAPYTVNFHIKDFSIKRLSHKMGFIVTGARVGNGMLDIHSMIDKLNEYKRCQSAILEQWVPLCNTLDDTATEERLWADQGINYLKQQPYFNR